MEIVLPQLHPPSEAFQVGAMIGARGVEVGGGHVVEQVQLLRPEVHAPLYFLGQCLCDGALGVLGEGGTVVDVRGRDGHAPLYFLGQCLCDGALGVLEGGKVVDVRGRDGLVVLVHCGVVVTDSITGPPALADAPPPPAAADAAGVSCREVDDGWG